MGRTVINETENKQTVILNDSPEGIKGGYFDEEMNWYKLGGGELQIDSIPFLWHTGIGTGNVSGATRARLTDNANRLTMACPITNTGKKYKALSTDYQLRLIGISSLEGTIASIGGNAYTYPVTVDHGYLNEVEETEAPYIWMSIKKDSEEFTADEVRNAYGSIFTEE